MFYTENFEILAHDIDPNDVARPSVIMRYLQEGANHQMRDEKPSYMDMFERGLAFLLSRIGIEIYAVLRPYDKIQVQSWPCTVQGPTFIRSYRMFRDSEVVAEAVGLWALIDTHTKKLLRTTDEDFSNYTCGDPIETIQIRNFRVPTGEVLTPVGQHTVAYSEIDCNLHMNNTNYPDILMNYIPEIEKGYISSMSLRFVTEAPLGEKLTVLRSQPLADSREGETSYYLRTERETLGGVNIEAKFSLKKEVR